MPRRPSSGHFTFLIGGLALLVTGARAAPDECHLASSPAIMCQDPKSAVMAFQALRFDTRKMNTSYNKQILHESWCALVADPGRKLSFETYSTGRIATPDGWVGVTQIGFKHDGMTDVRYVASAYVTGTCKHYRFDPNAQQSDSNSPRSPYLPTAPVGGYRSENFGAMP